MSAALMWRVKQAVKTYFNGLWKIQKNSTNKFRNFFLIVLLKTAARNKTLYFALMLLRSEYNINEGIIAK